MHLPQALDQTLETRQLNYGYNNRYRRRRTPWSSWGRWVLAGILIFVGLILAFMVLCMSKRRKRRAALLHKQQAPMTSAQPDYSQQNNYNNNDSYNQGANYNQGYAPPAGAPPATYEVGNSGYYGQQGGVTQPQGAYMK